MAILNRTKDITEQRIEMQVTTGAMATGVTTLIGLVPWPCTLDAANIAAYGTSGAPSYAINVDRFIAGTGFTTIVLATGTSNAVAAFGTSGAGSFGTSLFGQSAMILAGFGSSVAGQSGSTLLQLLANDVLVLTSSVANTAAKAVAISVSLKPIQDARSRFGVV